MWARTNVYTVGSWVEADWQSGMAKRATDGLKELLTATDRLCVALAELSFGPPVTHVYNPLIYAARSHRAYLERYARGEKRIVWLGMNPGPFGMAQTGVPFGEIAHVRDFLGIEAKVDRPACEHPARPIEGFLCTRSEVSGARLWGAIAARYGSADAFFAERFVSNYCPLVFMEASGKNRTPDKLPERERAPLFAACDDYLRTLAAVLRPRFVIGVGAFAEARARAALTGSAITVSSILHPSPASPLANRGWAAQAERQLEAIGLSL